MGHKKVPISCFYKVGIYSCNGNGTFGTRHGPFNGELNGPFVFNAAFACFQPSDFFPYLVHVLLQVSCVCKSGEACCYFLGYKMSQRKTTNDKSCVSCKEDDHARVFYLAIVPLCLYFNKNFENTRRLALMPSFRKSLDMPEALFPRRRSSKIRYLV